MAPRSKMSYLTRINTVGCREQSARSVKRVAKNVFFGSRVLPQRPINVNHFARMPPPVSGTTTHRHGLRVDCREPDNGIENKRHLKWPTRGSGPDGTPATRIAQHGDLPQLLVAVLRRVPRLLGTAYRVEHLTLIQLALTFSAGCARRNGMTCGYANSSIHDACSPESRPLHGVMSFW